VTGWFERIMNRIPMEIASALLAGVLAKFGMQAFSAAETNLSLVLVMLLAYLLSRRMAPRYAVIITLLAGTAWAALRGQMQWSAVHAGWPCRSIRLPSSRCRRSSAWRCPCLS
jgi:benzoate membrane transport protein